MKKVFLPVVLLCLATTMFAQKGNIAKAKTKAFNVEAPDPQGAKTLIEDALVHPETANLAKTWFEAGVIFNKIQQDETEKQRMGLAFDNNLRETCLLKVLPCFEKAYAMDQMPNEKGKVKPKYTKKIKYELLNLYRNYSIELAANEAFNLTFSANASAIPFSCSSLALSSSLLILISTAVFTNSSNSF